ncbi:ProQ/FINO family protein, partial [Halomonas sp. BC04]|uniref:ProQ/FINO family protein n=1 Tax=Halomonas sp. BC04 TaxID=1403540 RepID=UPI001E4F58F8
MIDERSLRLLNDLEVCADTALGELHGCRERIRQLQGRVAELEAAQGELEAARRALEAARLELEEENRELDEQNRELEEDNARLRERLRKGEPAPMFPGTSRRAQGLAALIGHRPREGASGEPGQPGEQAVPRGDDPQRQDEPNRQDAPGLGEAGLGEAGQETIEKKTDKKEGWTADKAEEKAEQGGPVQGEPVQGKEAQRENETGERQAQLPIEQAPSAEALLAEWYRRYPDTFFKGHTRPLKVGIHQDLAAREPWPEKLVRRALAGYVNLPRYLKAVREGAQRIDLAGRPDGSVDAQAAE